MNCHTLRHESVGSSAKSDHLQTKLKLMVSVLVIELDTDRATDTEVSTLSVLDTDALAPSNPTSVVVVKELVSVSVLAFVTSLPSILATDLVIVAFASPFL